MTPPTVSTHTASVSRESPPQSPEPRQAGQSSSLSPADDTPRRHRWSPGRSRTSGSLAETPVVSEWFLDQP